MTGFELVDENLERAAEKACSLFLEIYRGLEGRRVDPAAESQELRALFRDTIQDEGVGLLEALQEFEKDILVHSMGTPHPLYLGLVNSSPMPAAALADLLISSLNNNGGAYHQSPAFTCLENEVVRAFGELLGMVDPCVGMILPGGSFATLQGLALARQKHFPEWSSIGPGALPGQPVLYASEASHFSIAKGGRVLGLGHNGVVPIPTTGRGAMDVAALESRVAQDRRDGAFPFAAVATLGSTGTGAVDSLWEIADICEHYGLWLHVDACYGGAAALLEELQPLFAGIHKADSVAVDPHKWFFIPITAALLLHRHPRLEEQTFSVGGACYIPSGGEPGAFDRGLATSRRSSSLAVWLALRAHGWNAVRQAVRSNIRLTRMLEDLLAEEGFSVLPNGQLSVACARWEPEGWSGEQVNELQSAIAQHVVASGTSWFSTAIQHQKAWLRFNMVNLYTREHHVRKLVDQLVVTARMCAQR
jgi:aromatic-L-amino-acid decarboxylase